MRITALDKLGLIRMAGLIGRHRAVLSPFEAELVDDCVLRFRDRGDAMTLTANERQVLAEAIGAMDAAAAELKGADADAAAGMRGAA